MEIPSPTTPAGAPSGPRILLVEDDALLRETVERVLAQGGYRVLTAEDGRTGLELAVAEKPALLLLDIELPGMGGLQVLSRLKELGESVPVLVMSSRAHVDQRVEGLMAGADDYLTKPFEFSELMARVHALLRRRAEAPTGPRRLQLGDVAVDLVRQVVERGGATAKLTLTEGNLLKLLARHVGTPVSREQILDVVWGYTYLPSTRTLDTHIWRLRKKLGDDGQEPQWIRSVAGVGYLLADAAQLQTEGGGR